MIECIICNKQLKRVNNLHLRRAHGIILKEYKTMFPEVPTTCEETKAKIGQVTSKFWGDPNSGLRNRQSGWITRTKNGTRSGSLKGKTYEDLYGIEKAKQLKQLRRESGYWKYVSDEQRKLNWDIHLKLIQENLVYRQHYLKALAKHLSPNQSELKLASILDEIAPTFQYNGGYELGISLRGLIPDFVNTNGKKQVIELFGDYWHSETMAGSWHRCELGRTMAYHSIGYDCLVIWEHELKDKEKMRSKILSFTRRRQKKLQPNGL